MANTLLLGYPTPNLKGKLVAIVDHKGPLSYSSPESFKASDLGMGYIDAVIPVNGGILGTDSDQIPGGISLSGTYVVVPYMATTVDAGKSPTLWYLKWYTKATEAEVAGATNLSAETVRLLVIGG